MKLTYMSLAKLTNYIYHCSCIGYGAKKRQRQKENGSISQDSTTRGKKHRNSTTQADDQSPP